MTAIITIVWYWRFASLLVAGGNAVVPVDHMVSELGTLDILVNNAAYQMTREGIEQIPDGEWGHTW